jgi:hypothetical protein
MKMEQTECSETSAYKIQTPENCPEENIQHSQHDESLKSRSYINSFEDVGKFKVVNDTLRWPDNEFLVV